VWEVVATEAAKTVTASVSGVVIAGAGKVLRSLRRRMSKLPGDPAELAALIARIGEQDPVFAAEIAEAVAGLSATAVDVGVLPPALFVDRDAVRAQLAGPGLWVIAGAYGVGKTALVSQVSQEVAVAFPGGHAYVDLDDYRDGEVLRTAEVKAAVLRQLGVDGAELAEPVLGEQYLRALVHRRFVLVLENVAGVAEVRSLAQPWPASLVLVTTRKLTDDLRIWSPTAPIILHGVDEAGAWQLLASRCGPSMLQAEPQAAVQLLELCDRMPFAILQVGVRLSRRHGEPGAVGAVRKEFEGAPDTEGLIQACLSRTVAELSSTTVDDLVVLATHPGDEVSYAAVQAMLGRPARGAVDELVDACLVAPGPRGRLRPHRLVRRYAARLVEARGVDVDAAFDRLLSFYRDHAVAADLAGGDRLRRYQVPEGLSFALPDIEPLDWLQAEAGAIGAVIAQAYHRRRYLQVCQLCGALEVLLTSRGHHWLVAGANEWGILAARNLGEPVLEARLHAMQGRILTQLHLLDRADEALAKASRLLSGVDDPRMHSSILEFHARSAEERADTSRVPDYTRAVETFGQCLAIDEGSGLLRALGLHQRMLANVMVKAGRADDAITLLDHAAAHTSDVRNDARVRMVRARALAALGDLAGAQAAVTRARELTVQAGATQYDVDLADIEAQIAWRAGDLESARSRWGWIAQAYWHTGHPRFDLYLTKLNQLPPPPR